MSTCLKEEKLQAFVDNELDAAEKESAATHLGNCAECRDKLDAIQSSAVKLNAIMDSLVPQDSPEVLVGSIVGMPRRTSAPRMGWVGIASVATVAAMILLAIVFARRGPVGQQAPAAASVTQAPAIETVASNLPAVVVHATIRKHKPSAQPKALQFQALDDRGPIEEGLIYRINLPVSVSGVPIARRPVKTVPAEVIVDDMGEVRAIRFLQ